MSDLNEYEPAANMENLRNPSFLLHEGETPNDHIVGRIGLSGSANINPLGCPCGFRVDTLPSLLVFDIPIRGFRLLAAIAAEHPRLADKRGLQPCDGRGPALRLARLGLHGPRKASSELTHY
ncbi:hypothetical protein CU103_19630 [Phyllobacterium sophorae]|uniref:Uncharacterized protein n=1 Tax=Phyllobacterium sophorae TaxID=1520277 RepID=A0A2P7B6H8_9HYPH|nr:hypothetical protein CU103_19630 [Phyllobacterium sophorae]